MKHLGFYTGYRKTNHESPSSYPLVLEDHIDFGFAVTAYNPYAHTSYDGKWGKVTLGKSKGFLSVPIEYLT